MLMKLTIKNTLCSVSLIGDTHGKFLATFFFRFKKLLVN